MGQRLHMPDQVGAIRRDVDADITVITAPRVLAAHLAESLGRTLCACLDECPHAVLIDLSECAEVSAEALAMVVAAAGTVSPDRPSVRVAVCGAPVAFHSATCPSYPDCLNAETHLAAARARDKRLRHRFSPTPTAAADARAQVRRACREWSLLDVVDAAALVASELVSNAVSHARTDGTLEMTLRGDFVQIRVTDGDPNPPRSTQLASHDTHGRGLRIVRRLSSAMGYRVDHAGSRKVVWSALRWRPAT